MTHLIKYGAIILLCGVFAMPAFAADDHVHDTPEFTEISADSAQTMKIGVETVGSGTVNQTISLTGKITLNKNRMAQVRARFPGIVRDVKSNIGDTVKKGQILAIIESNQSLQDYAVVAPLDGVILGRNTNVGDTAENDTIFVVADLKNLWAEFFIFSRDMNKVKAGQIIRIRSLVDEEDSDLLYF